MSKEKKKDSGKAENIGALRCRGREKSKKIFKVQTRAGGQKEGERIKHRRERRGDQRCKRGPKKRGENLINKYPEVRTQPMSREIVGLYPVGGPSG